MGSSFSNLNLPYDERLSLKDSRHRLSQEFSPDLDLSMYMNTMQSGNIEGAQTLKQYMRIKYADYPEIMKGINKLKNRPWAVSDLTALNPMHGLDIEDQFEDLKRNSI